MQSSQALYGALLLSGFLGSLGHCLGMCGPLALMAGLRFRSKHGSPPFFRHLLYHASRVGVYGALGAVAAGIGALLGLAEQLRSMTGILSLLLGLGVIALGLGSACGLSGAIERQGAWITRAIRCAMEWKSPISTIALGALNGLLPCCLTYSALFAAASTGNSLRGALAMLLFGAATMPALLLVNMGAAFLQPRLRLILHRIAVLLLFLVGLQLVLRGLASMDVLPSLRLGQVVVW